MTRRLLLGLVAAALFLLGAFAFPDPTESRPGPDDPAAFAAANPRPSA